MHIQDNHISAAGGIEPALRQVQAHLRTKNLSSVPVEIEVKAPVLPYILWCEARLLDFVRRMLFREPQGVFSLQ